MSNNWTEPDLGTLYLLYDEDGLPYAIVTYLDLVIDIEDVDLWPSCDEDVETLLWAYDAWPLGRTVAGLERDARHVRR